MRILTDISIKVADRRGFVGIGALLFCILILSFTYRETYKFFFFFDRARTMRLQPDLVSGIAALLMVFVLWKTKALEESYSRPVRYTLIALFLYVCAALAAGVIKGSSTTGFLRLGSDILTFGKYWPVVLTMAVLIVAAFAHRYYKLAVVAASAILVVFNLSPVSDAMGIAGFPLLLFFGIGFWSMLDTEKFRTTLSS